MILRKSLFSPLYRKIWQIILYSTTAVQNFHSNYLIIVSKKDLLKFINLYVTVKIYEKVFIQQNLLLYEQHELLKQK